MIPTIDRPFPVYRRFLPGLESTYGVMHVVNRVAGGSLLFGPEEKEQFRSYLFRASAFCGIEVLTWTCLGNHFHALLLVPNEVEAKRLRGALTEADLLARMDGCFSREFIRLTRCRLENFRSTPGLESLADSIVGRMRAQTHDVSAFMHMVQRRFSAWYNRRHGRKGTLWQGRFRSTLVEPSGEALLRTAAYIDLNSVRAGLARSPSQYRWCGHADAMAGKEDAVAGRLELVRRVTGQNVVDVTEALEIYRGWLGETDSLEGRESPSARRTGGDSSAAGPKAGARSLRKVPLGRAELLRCRVRYFTAALAIGSRSFVEAVFLRYRESFGPARRTGPRPLRCGEWSGLCGLRNLRNDVVAASAEGDAG